MKLIDLVERAPVPLPWDEGYKIPWNEPGFSERMLPEHLTQEHDAASRRFAKIDRAVEWIHGELLEGRTTKILDLGCGPGLYAARFARLGHECVGIDFGPASVAYAREQAEKKKLNCTFVEQDIRTADYGSGFGMAMLIFGEFNVFTMENAKVILTKAREALDDGGLLVLEPHTFEAVRRTADSGSWWYSTQSGLFMDGPHIQLEENFWDEESRTATTRYFIIDAVTGQVQRHAATMQAYTDEEYRSLLEECGFGEVQFFPSLTGEVDEEIPEFFALVAR